MLRSLIHLEEIDGGSICVSGNHMVKDGVYAKPHEIKQITGKKWEWCFSIFNLFPHLTVKEKLGACSENAKKGNFG
ncbi:hypothetical protein GCM10020331_102250 [Ectobacillus funiculus]